VNLSSEERQTLESMARKYTSPYRDVIRAKIILLANEGLSNDVIASRLDPPRQIVSKWRKRFAIARLPGLEEQSRSRGGRKARFSPQSRRSGQGTGLRASLHPRAPIVSSLQELEQRLLAFQSHYERSASPFNWTFTRHDLHALLAKIATKQLASAA
jgi:transposase